MAVQLGLEEPTMAEQWQPEVELVADAWVLAKRPPLAVLLAEVVQAVAPCHTWGLDKASTFRRLPTSM